MKVETRYTRIGAIAFLILFVSYYVITSLYVHVHEVNGKIIVHSHPFTEHHSHSNGQALTLHFLSVFSSLESHATEAVCPDFPLLYLLIGNFIVFRALSSRGQGIYLRAPPHCLFIKNKIRNR